MNKAIPFFFLTVIAIVSVSCTKKQTYEPDPCQNSNLQVDVVVNGNQITATGTGGAPPYYFDWSSGDTYNGTTSTITVTTPGTYVVDVTDKDGCTITDDAVVNVQPTPTKVTDIDGNEYNIVKIGNQYWMKENLKTTRFWTGDTIPTGFSNSAWAANMLAAYSIYEENPSNNDTYGKLYNYYAASDARLCPQGWHIPTDGEWKTLEIFLGISSSDAALETWRGTVEGGKLKALTLWQSPNSSATNSTNFTALPAGQRSFGNGIYAGLSTQAIYWTSTKVTGGQSFCRVVDYSHGSIWRGQTNPTAGYSCRCLKD